MSVSFDWRLAIRLTKRSKSMSLTGPTSLLFTYYLEHESRQQTKVSEPTTSCFQTVKSACLRNGSALELFELLIRSVETYTNFLINGLLGFSLIASDLLPGS